MKKASSGRYPQVWLLLVAGFAATFPLYSPSFGQEGAGQQSAGRTRQLLDNDWRFTKGDPDKAADMLLYDVRPAPTGRGAPPPPAVPTPPPISIAKPWILPAANDFIKDAAR